jgi:hypothetical protein
MGFEINLSAIGPMKVFMTKKKKDKKKGVCHTVALPFTLKSILRQKKNYGNSNISLCKKYDLQKIL